MPHSTATSCNGSPRSGEQAVDIWEALQVHLWFVDRKAAEKRRELAAHNARAKLRPVEIEGSETNKIAAENGIEGAGADGGGGQGAAKDISAAAMAYAAARALAAVEARRDGGGGAGVESSGKGQGSPRQDAGAVGGVEKPLETAPAIKLEKADGEGEGQQEFRVAEVESNDDLE